MSPGGNDPPETTYKSHYDYWRNNSINANSPLNQVKTLQKCKPLTLGQFHKSVETPQHQYLPKHQSTNITRVQPKGAFDTASAPQIGHANSPQKVSNGFNSTHG